MRGECASEKGGGVQGRESDAEEYIWEMRVEEKRRERERKRRVMMR